MKYDYLIVGAGLFGAVCARELTDKGYRCLIIDKRNHIGGNCYTEKRDGINLHMYGPHIFHTSNDEVWRYLNKHTSITPFILNIVANYNGEIYPLPFNMFTFSKMWNIYSPKQAEKIITEQSSGVGKSQNLEEQAIKLVGTDIYEKLIKGYTTKQWGRDPKQLPANIIKRLPVRLTYDNNYFNDPYQGIPDYTKLFDNLLDGIDIRLNTDWFDEREYWDNKSKLIYTGPIDKFFDYKYGNLEYRTLRFIHSKIAHTDNYQGCAIMNFTDKCPPFTRIIEHKYFENVKSNVTWITHEFPDNYVKDQTEPYYPINDERNDKIYSKYKSMAEKLPNVYFGGRLAEYKYYNMDNTIESALKLVENEIKNNI